MHVELQNVPVSNAADYEVWVRVEERTPKATAFRRIVGEDRFL